MTLQDKTVTKYVNDIKKQLRVPAKMKSRIVSDLDADIGARMEAGEAIEQIIADMGTPKEVANGFNNELAGCKDKGSPWRYVFLILAILMGFWMILTFISMFTQPEIMIGTGKGEQSGATIFARNYTTPLWFTFPLMVGCLMEYFLLKWGKNGTRIQYTIIIVVSISMMIFFTAFSIWYNIKTFHEFEKTINMIKGDFKSSMVISIFETFLLPGFWLPLITLIVSIRKRKNIAQMKNN